MENNNNNNKDKVFELLGFLLRRNKKNNGQRGRV